MVRVRKNDRKEEDAMSRGKGIRKFVIAAIIMGMVAGFGIGVYLHQPWRTAVAGLTTDQIMHNVWNQTDNTLKITVDDLEITSQTDDLKITLDAEEVTVKAAATQANDLKVTLDSEAVVLGAGTEEIGKLAAGLAEIGKLGAGTASIGKISEVTSVAKVVGDVIDITFYPVTERSYTAGGGATQTSGVALANKLLFTGVINGAPNADLWSVDLNNRLEAVGGASTAEMWFWVVAGNGISGVSYNNIMAEEDVTITASNDILVFTSDLGGPSSIDVPDGSYTMAEYAAALQVVMNADNTLTSTQTIVFALDYNVTAESKITIDADTGHTIAFTFAGSDGDDVIGMWDDISGAQTIASHIGVPNQLESAVPNTATAKSVDANRCGTFPTFWDETAFSIKVYMAADETDATCRALDTTAVIVKAITK